MKIECEIIEQAWDGIIPHWSPKYDAIMAGMSIKAKREKVIFWRHYAATPIRFAVPKGSDLASYQSKLENVSIVSGDEKAALDDPMGALTKRSGSKPPPPMKTS